MVLYRHVDTSRLSDAPPQSLPRGWRASSSPPALPSARSFCVSHLANGGTRAPEALSPLVCCRVFHFLGVYAQLELRGPRWASGDQLFPRFTPLFNPHPVEPSQRLVRFTTQLQGVGSSICGRARKSTYAKRFAEGGTKRNFQQAKVAKSLELGV